MALIQNFVSETTLERAQLLLAGISHIKSRYAFPWIGIEQDLVSVGVKQLNLLGYGSLLNKASAEIHLNTPRYQPILALSAMRVYDYVLRDDAVEWLGPPSSPDAVMTLNAYPTDAVTDSFNGVLAKISLNEIEQLREREKDYDLVLTAYVNWLDPEEDLRLGYYLSCPRDVLSRRAPDLNSLTPHLEYHRICSRGAQAISQTFFRYFCDSTYLSDMMTTVTEWLETSNGKKA